MSDQTPPEGELILYRTADDAVRVEVLYESETFWLDQRRMAELFGVDVRTISYHLKEVYSSGELTPEAALRRIWRVQREGRIWATQTLRELIVKGFVLDDEGLKLNKALRQGLSGALPNELDRP